MRRNRLLGILVAVAVVGNSCTTETDGSPEIPSGYKPGAEDGKYDSIPASCFNGYMSTIKELSGTVFGKNESIYEPEPSDSLLSYSKRCQVGYVGVTYPPDGPEQGENLRKFEIQYTLHSAGVTDSATKKAQDHFNSLVPKSATNKVRIVPGLGEQAISWQGKARIAGGTLFVDGGHATVRVSNVVIDTAVRGKEYLPSGYGVTDSDPARLAEDAVTLARAALANLDRDPQSTPTR